MDAVEKFKKRKVFVRNAHEGEYKKVDNALEKYYEAYPTRRRTSCACPSCGQIMYRKKSPHPLLIESKPIIVGGHLKLNQPSLRTSEIVYILPICEYCNNKKGNLSPFEVEMCDLLPVK